MIGLCVNKQAYRDEEDEDEIELEELGIVEEVSGDGWVVEDGDLEVEKDEDEETNGSVVVSGEGVGEAIRDDPPRDSSDRLEGRTEVDKLLERAWRWCNQCRFSSVS